jgi:K+-sensing histidine kinase KdpD
MKTDLTSSLRARDLKKIFRSLLAGRCVRVLGPRFTGKSELIRQAVAETKQELTPLVSYQSMEDYKEAGWPDFFSVFYQRIASDILPGQERPLQVTCPAPVDLQYNMLNLLHQCNRTVVIFIDDLEIAPPNLIASLMGVIRAVFNTRVSGSSPRFQAVVCGSLSFSQLALPHVSRFESISDLVLVGDLDLVEREAMFRDLCSNAGIFPSDDGLADFLECTGGDRSLIHQLFEIAQEALDSTGQTQLTPAIVEDACTLFITNMMELPTGEVIRQIEAEPNLLACTLQILSQGRVLTRELKMPSLETPNLLDLSGVFRQEGEYYQVKSRLWQLILGERLNKARVGRLYALAGYWPQALHALTQAAALQHADVRLDLFNATINAMHASADGKEALLFLAKGLEGIYPGLPFRIYQRTASELVQVFPMEEPAEYILLSGSNQPEIEALRGPDYSVIFEPKRTRFLFPLRLRSNAEPVGMLSFGEPFNRYLHEGHQEEIYQLIGFLRQAVSAVEARDTYAALLLDAQKRAEKQNNLNKILTRILDLYALSDEAVLRLVMAGITAGLCLEFNRAILFIYDEQRKALVAQIGVGHLTRPEASEDWKTVQETVEALIGDLLVPDYKYTTLHNRVKGTSIPAHANARNIFARVMTEQEPRISRRQVLLEGLPQSFLDAIGGAETFALVPYNAGSQMRGLLYVDNRFTQRDISDERIFLLSTFMNQAALAIKLAKALKQEQKHNLQMAGLLRAEEAINDQITQQVQGVLDQIAGSARTLFQTKSAVLYTFTHQVVDGLSKLVTDQIVFKGTVQNHSNDNQPSPDRGITRKVIEEGFIHITDIEQARSANENAEVWQNSFVRAEAVRSSVGIRLGSAEDPEGVLYLNWDDPHPLADEDRAIMTIFTSFAAVTIPSARRYQQVQEDLQHREREMEGLSQLIRAGVELWSEEEIQEIIHQALQTTRDLTRIVDLRLIRRGPRSQFQQYHLGSSGQLVIQVIDQAPDRRTAQAFSQEKSIEKYIETGSGLCWPIEVGGNVLGVLDMETNRAAVLVDKHAAYLGQLCNRLALTFHQAEVYQALSKLFQAALRMTQDTEREDFLDGFMDVLVREALESVRSVDTITSYYIDKDLETLKAGPYAGLFDKESLKKGPLEKSVVMHVLNANAPIFAENVREDEVLYGPFVDREQIKSAAAFPLRVGEKRVGSIFFSYRHFQKFDPGEKSLLNLFAQLAAIAINYARLLEDARRQKKRLETVARIAENLVAAGPDLDTIYSYLFREVLQVVPHADNACIIQVDPDRQDYFIVPASKDFYKAVPQEGQEFYRVGHVNPRGIAIRVIETGEARLSNDISVDPDYIAAIPTTLSEVCAPIVLDGQPHAVILLESDQRDAFTEDDKLLLTALAPIISIAIQRVQQILRARERAELEKMSRLAVGLVHEITRAVANIPDLVEEIQTSLAKGEAVDQECLEDLQSNAIQAKRVSTYVRDLSTVGGFNPKPDHLEPVIEKVVDAAGKNLPDHCQVVFEPDQPLPTLTFHAELIEILLKNIVENALRAIPPSRNGLIVIRAETRQMDVSISIQDNGTGIDTDHQPKVFEEPFTTKEDQSQMHGVGLWLCNQIAEIHKGRLEFETHPGIGTTFIVRLPR